MNAPISPSTAAAPPASQMTSAPSKTGQVQIINLLKRYGEGPVILEDINLDVQQGEFISLIGASGCGKSTLLKLIASLTPITEGSLRIDGKTPTEMRGELAFIFQEATLLPWTTARKNVEMPLRLKGVDKSVRRQKADEMLERVGLGHAKESYPRQLSGGMKMRVSIARALSLKPRVLLLDEPFGALDEMTRDRLNEDLLEFRRQEEWTAFFVTHSVAEAVFLSSRIVVLSANPGRIANIIEIPLAYPRNAETRETTEYQKLVAHVSHELRKYAAHHVSDK
ncbi:MAG: ABC transporter ATP-binding protein [Opitutales bacterium]